MTIAHLNKLLGCLNRGTDLAISALVSRFDKAVNISSIHSSMSSTLVSEFSRTSRAMEKSQVETVCVESIWKA